MQILRLHPRPSLPDSARELVEVAGAFICSWLDNFEGDRMRKPATVVIMNECSNMGCRRRPVVARKVSDFWVTQCDRCLSKEITLDIERISRAAGDFYKPRRRLDPAA